MLDNLPSELLYIICKNLDINSVKNLKHTNIKLYDSINILSNGIFKNEIKKINIRLNPFLVLNSLENFCKVIIYKNTKSNYKNTIYKSFNPIKNLTNYIENNSNNFILYNISYNINVNKLFKDILEHFIYYETLKNYDKIKLLFLYNFLQIEQFNINQINYYIEFIENITCNKFIKKYDDIIINYYSFIIKSLNLEESFIYYSETNYTRNITNFLLENLYKISKWVITPHIMEKLISYKPLNLYTAELLVCCDRCFKKPIKNIVEKKFYLRDDELIGHNYLCITELFYKNNFKSIVNYILIYIEQKQKILVNRYIYITNPITNERKQIKNIKLNHNKTLKKNQKFLINKIFN